MKKHLVKFASIITIASMVLTFVGVGQAQETTPPLPPPPNNTFTPPPTGNFTPPPGGTFTPPPNTNTPPPNNTFTPPPNTNTPPPTGMQNTDPSAGCTSSGGKWCPNSTGAGGWCSFSNSPCSGVATTPNTPPTTTTTPDTSRQTTCSTGGKWCQSSSGSGWCSYGTEPCPAYDTTTCSAQNGKWCAGSGGTSGWCMTGGGTCPANDAASCAAQSGEWCQYTGTPTTGGPTGWCAQNGASCPANSETECKAKNRLWCMPQASSYSGGSVGGWCANIGEKCPAYTKAACESQGSEWCVGAGTTSGGWCMTSGGGCPINDQATCNAKGKTWCKPTAGSYSIGWCMTGASMGSYGATTPSTCGYGYEPVPTTSTPTIPKPEILPPIVVCADGTTPPAGTTCTDNTVSGCAKKGGIWCADTTGKSQSYCSLSGSCTTMPVVKPPIETPTEKIIEKLTDRDIKAAERERSSILRSLAQLVPMFKKFDDTTAVTKAQALVDKIKGLPMDPAIFQNLQSMRDEVDALKEYRDELSNNQDETAPVDSERDQALKARALKSFQRDVRGFDKNFTTIQARIKTIEKAGYIVSTDLKEALNKAVDMVKQISATTSYDEAQDIMEILRDTAAIINDEVTNLEQVGQLANITPSVNRKIAQVESSIKSLGTIAKRLGGDIAASIAGLSSRVGEVRVAMTQIKTGDFGDQEPFEYFQTEVADKLEDIFLEVENIKAVANLRQTLTKFSGKISRYNSRLNTLRRKGTDVSEAEILLDEAKARVDDLKKLAGKAVTADTAAEAKEIMDALGTISESLDSSLGIKTSSLFGDELQKAGTKSTLPRLQISQLDRATLKGIRVATLFQRTPNSVLVYLPNQSLAASKLRRTRFVIDQ